MQWMVLGKTAGAVCFSAGSIYLITLISNSHKDSSTLHNEDNSIYLYLISKPKSSSETGAEIPNAKITGFECEIPGEPAFECELSKLKDNSFKQHKIGQIKTLSSETNHADLLASKKGFQVKFKKSVWSKLSNSWISLRKQFADFKVIAKTKSKKYTYDKLRAVLAVNGNEKKFGDVSLIAKSLIVGITDWTSKTFYCSVDNRATWNKCSISNFDEKKEVNKKHSELIFKKPASNSPSSITNGTHYLIDFSSEEDAKKDQIEKALKEKSTQELQGQNIFVHNQKSLDSIDQHKTIAFEDVSLAFDAGDYDHLFVL